MESGFSTVDVEIIYSLDLSVCKLIKPVDYISKSGMHYRIPIGASTDFASVPKELWGALLFLIPTGWYSLPAELHDSAYQNTLQVIDGQCNIMIANLNEQESNDLLLEAMQSIKPQPTLFEKAQMDAIYEGVTIGGWHAFKEDRS